MSDKIKASLKNTEAIKKIIKKTSITHKLETGESVEVLLSYLPLDESGNNYSSLLKLIKDGVLERFVLRCSEIEKKQGIESSENKENLLKKSIRKLSTHTARGELGELLLFTLLETYYQAPKILSKMSLKTNAKMPVHGADAVHGQFIDGEFRLYLGESKLRKSFKNAAGDAAKSIKNAIVKYEEEYDLLDSFMDFEGLTEELESKLLELLNPFANKDFSDIIESPCFIGFSEEDLINKVKTEEELIDEYRKLSRDYIAHYYKKTKEAGVAINKTSLLMLPFACVEQLTKDFIDYLEIN